MKLPVVKLNNFMGSVFQPNSLPQRKERRCLKSLLIGKDGGGEVGYCYCSILHRSLAWGSSLHLIPVNQRKNVVTDISIELLLTFIPLGFSI